jgi:hypothetical protein
LEGFFNSESNKKSTKGIMLITDTETKKASNNKKKNNKKNFFLNLEKRLLGRFNLKNYIK